jgi:hypothetical protein
MADVYEVWLDQVRVALGSINMAMEDWQQRWSFDFHREHDAGTTPDEAAMKANRFWWREQNRSLKQDCRQTKDCWLQRGHQGRCQPVTVEKSHTMPTYERGDYVKVEFPDETTGIGEWMWVRVHHCDDEKKLVYGTLDNEPVNDYESRIELGSGLAVSYSQIREHKKPTEFTKQ